MAIISPSILSADFAKLGEEVENLTKWGADWVHLDVMDGSFVSNISFGNLMCKELRKHSKLPFDVHLMVENPVKWIPTYKELGADIFTFHVEADRHAHRTLQKIKDCGMCAGIALNPGTPLSMIEYLLPICDLVLIMSVNPGAPAQSFIPSTITKIRELSEMIAERDLSIKIEVDGGVNPLTARHCLDAGADALVAGSSVFSSDNPRDTIRRLRCED